VSQRMKKGLVVFSIIAAFVFSMGVMAWVYAAAPQKAPDVIKIDNDKALFKDGKRTKPPVEFSHLKHQKDYKIACADCHHVYKDGKNTWKQGDKVQKCGECHKAAEEGKKLTLQNAYHKNCKDCHAKMKAENKKTGPTLCAQCHVEKK
jgi:hypothetical protein